MTCIEQGYIHGTISTSLGAISLVSWETISRLFKSIVSAVNLLLREGDDSVNFGQSLWLDSSCAETWNLLVLLQSYCFWLPLFKLLSKLIFFLLKIIIPTCIIKIICTMISSEHLRFVFWQKQIVIKNWTKSLLIRP